MAEKQKAEKKIVEVERRKNSTGRLKAAAWFFWMLAIICQVAALLIIEGTIYVPENKFAMWILVMLAADIVLVTVAGRLWKKANDGDRFTMHYGYGFGIFLTKRLALIMAIVCIVPAVCWFFAADRNPDYAEEMSQAKAVAISCGADTVYWTTFGRDYHFDPVCPSLSMSKTLYEGDVSDAFAANRHCPCNFCVPQGVKTEQ